MYPFVRQHDAMDCGPACIGMIARWHGKRISLESIRKRAWITREGVSLLGLRSAAVSLGFKAEGMQIPFSVLAGKISLPCIVHWQQNHFIVVNRISGKKVWVSDPAIGRMSMSREEFLRGWSVAQKGGEPAGTVLLLEPGPEFHALSEDPPPGSGFSFLLPYLKPYRRQMALLLAGLLAGSAIQLVLSLSYAGDN